jgi:hypothetical protein
MIMLNLCLADMCNVNLYLASYNQSDNVIVVKINVKCYPCILCIVKVEWFYSVTLTPFPATYVREPGLTIFVIDGLDCRGRHLKLIAWGHRDCHLPEIMVLSVPSISSGQGRNVTYGMVRINTASILLTVINVWNPQRFCAHCKSVVCICS